MLLGNASWLIFTSTDDEAPFCLSKWFHHRKTHIYAYWLHNLKISHILHVYAIPVLFLVKGGRGLLSAGFHGDSSSSGNFNGRFHKLQFLFKWGIYCFNPAGCIKIENVESCILLFAHLPHFCSIHIRLVAMATVYQFSLIYCLWIPRPHSFRENHIQPYVYTTGVRSNVSLHELHTNMQLEVSIMSLT